MLLVAKIFALLFVALTMGLALAHALEMPGKWRLDKNVYLAVQTIYYPGFTIGGAFEPLSVVAVILVARITHPSHTAVWLMLIAAAALILMHAVFWIVTQPVNRYWLKAQRLTTVGKQFFSIPTTASGHETTDGGDARWTTMRDRWEYSHLARAIFALITFITLSAGLLVG